MALRSPAYRMAQAALGADLVPALAQLYAETESWELVARRLGSDHGIIVSGQTLRRWAVVLGIESTSTAAPAAEAV